MFEATQRKLNLALFVNELKELGEWGINLRGTCGYYPKLFTEEGAREFLEKIKDVICMVMQL